MVLIKLHRIRYIAIYGAHFKHEAIKNYNKIKVASFCLNGGFKFPNWLQNR